MALILQESKIYKIDSLCLIFRKIFERRFDLMLLKAIMLIALCYVVFVGIEIYFSRKADARQAKNNHRAY